jgi:hypothetical protein
MNMMTAMQAHVKAMPATSLLQRPRWKGPRGKSSSEASSRSEMQICREITRYGQVNVCEMVMWLIAEVVELHCDGILGTGSWKQQAASAAHGRKAAHG